MFNLVRMNKIFLFGLLLIAKANSDEPGNVTEQPGNVTDSSTTESIINTQVPEQSNQDQSQDQSVPTEFLKTGVPSLFCDGFPSPGVSKAIITNATQFSMNTCNKNSIIKSIVTYMNYSTPVTCNGMIATVLPWSFFGKFQNGSIEVMNITNLYSRMAILNGNMVLAQSGMINGTACHGSIYLEVSILVPGDQYKCVTTGLDVLYFIYQLILIKGKCQSNCHLIPAEQEQTAEGVGKPVDAKIFDLSIDISKIAPISIGGRHNTG